MLLPYRSIRNNLFYSEYRLHKLKRCYINRVTLLVSIFFIILIILCILFRDIVISGAAEGLLIWYRNVVPVLLPFMIISRYFVDNFKIRKNSRFLACIATVIIGILCGYPMGAKTGTSFLKQGKIDKPMCQILLPLCNNLSPMFLAGYIHKQVLKEQVSIYALFLAVYLPYLLLTVLLITIYFKTEKSSGQTEHTNLQNTEKREPSHEVLSDCIRQITVIGIYIMIFSILLEIIVSLFGSNQYAIILASQMEITKGSMLLSSLPYSCKIKTALIVSAASFGGISALYQTKDAMGDSGLSIIKYTLCKISCALLSGILIYQII